MLWFLAQTNSTGINDFFGQIASLVVATGIAGIAWFGLVFLIFRRSQERRRREAAGLEPLPGVWVQLRNLVFPPEDTPKSTLAEDDIPTPSLDSLTSDIPLPDTGALLSDLPSPEPSAPLPMPQDPPVDLNATKPLNEDPETPHDPNVTNSLIDMLDSEDGTSVETTSTMAAMIPTSSPASIPVEANSILQNDQEVLRVYRDVVDGALIINMRGTVFSHMSEIDPTSAKKFKKLLRDMFDIVQEKNPPPETPRQITLPPAPLPQVVPPTSEPVLDLPPATKPMDTPKPTLDSPPPQQPQTPLSFFSRGDAPPAPEPLSIADQIEGFLQRRLLSNPQFAALDLHVLPSMDGGVRIQVGDMYYEAVSDVADPTVRQFLQDVIDDWSSQ